MSFSGDLEHLPLVDVIQLLQQTSKSGTLRLTGAKGECQLGFREGFIVSANHVNTGFRVGSILVELGIITRESLDLTLAEQALRGKQPPPLIALLVETGRVKREEAWRGLRTLIELTIVEVLTWPRGRFELDVEQVLVSDEYRYFPDHQEPPPQVSTQNILMEALRIFDERKRDGSLQQEAADAGEAAGAPEETISADDLGLGDVERLVRRTPSAAVAPDDRQKDDSHRLKVRKELAGFPANEQERLVSFLSRASEQPPPGEAAAGGGVSLAVILFTRDQLFSHAVMSCGAVRDLFVFATDEPQDLAHIIEQSLAKDMTPLLVLDPPGEGEGALSDESTEAALQSLRAGYPPLSFIRLVEAGRDDQCLRALATGSLTALPKPNRAARPSSFVDDFILFTEAFLACLQRAGAPPGWLQPGDFRERFAELDGLTKPSEISLSLLQFVASHLPRALTLIVSGADVIAERGIGLQGGRAVTPALKFRIPVERSSVFAAAIDGGRLHWGPGPEEPALRLLYDRIGEPHSPKIVVLPLKNAAGRVLALTYGDFGPAWATPVPIDLLDVFARHAGLVLDAVAQRRTT